MKESLAYFAVITVLGVMLGTTLVDMSVGSESTIREAVVWLVSRI